MTHGSIITSFVIIHRMKMIVIPVNVLMFPTYGIEIFANERIAKWLEHSDGRLMAQASSRAVASAQPILLGPK